MSEVNKTAIQSLHNAISRSNQPFPEPGFVDRLIKEAYPGDDDLAYARRCGALKALLSSALIQIHILRSRLGEATLPDNF